MVQSTTPLGESELTENFQPIEIVKNLGLSLHLCEDQHGDTVGFRIYRRNESLAIAAEIPTIEFNDWEELSSFAAGLALHFLTLDMARAAKQDMLPEALCEGRWFWIKDPTRQSQSLVVRQDYSERLEKLVETLNNGHTVTGVKHQLLLLSGARIYETPDKRIQISFPAGGHEHPILSSHELVGLLVLVLSDTRTEEIHPENYSPFIYGPATRALIRQCSQLQINEPIVTEPFALSSEEIGSDDTLMRANQHESTNDGPPRDEFHQTVEEFPLTAEGHTLWQKNLLNRLESYIQNFSSSKEG
jgi:hypothetical protein